MVADTIDKAHLILKDMMEWASGGLEWSLHHNSPFKMSKLAVLDLARTPRDIASSPLCITQINPDNPPTTHTILAVNSYKYLGVIFNLKLNWRAHILQVIGKSIHWSQQLWRLVKMSGGLWPSSSHQLYNTVAIPALTYASDVWYVPPFKVAHSSNSCGSVGPMKLLHSIQGQVSRFITGGMRGTALDVLEVHANIPLVDLLFHKVQTNAATHICALPKNHPFALIT